MQCSSTSLEAEGPVHCCKVTRHDDLGSEPLVAAGVDKVVNVFTNRRLSATLTGLSTSASAIGIDRGGRRIAAGTQGGSLKLWDVATSESIHNFTTCHRTAITSIDYHPFAEFLATASHDTHVRIWDLRKKACLQVYKHKDGVAAPIEVVKIAPDGLMAASGGADGVIRLYDLRGGKPLATLQHHTTAISCVAFHPGRQALVAVSVDGVVSVWDVTVDRHEMYGATDATANSTHAAVVDDNIITAGSGTLMKWTFPKIKSSVATKDVKLAGPIGDIHASPDGTVTVVGINNCALNVLAVTGVRGGGDGGARSAPARGGAAATAASGVPRLVGAAARKASPAQQQPRSAEPRKPAEPALVAPPAPLRTVGAPSSPVVAVHDPRDRAATSPRPDFKQPLGSGGSSGSGGAGAAVPRQAPAHFTSPPAARQRSPTKASGAGSSAGNAGAPPAPPPVDVDLLIGRGNSMAALMERRQAHLRMLRTSFQRRVEECFAYANQLVRSEDGNSSDTGAVVDLVETIAKSSRVTDRITLDSCAAALTMSDGILSRHEQPRYVAAAIEMARVLWVRFCVPIRDLERGAKIGIKNDLAMEQRLERSRAALRAFETIKSHALRFSPSDNEAGAAARKYVETFSL